MLKTIVDLLDGFIDRGEAIAVRQMDTKGSHVLSFNQLATDATAFARGLIQRGIKKGQPVALCAPGGYSWIVACLGTLRAGGIVVPVDMQVSGAALEHLISDSGVTIWMTTQGVLNEQLKPCSKWNNPTVIFLDSTSPATSWQSVIDEASDEQLPSINEEDGAFMFYTSGTTGPPKGVPLPHGKFTLSLNALIQAGIVEAKDRAVLPLPMHHVYPVLGGVLYPLSQGCEVIFPTELTGPELVRAIHEGQATAFVGVPRLYSAMIAGIYGKAQAKGGLGYALFRLLTGTSIFLKKHFNLNVGKTLLKPIHRNLNPELRVMASAGSKLDAELAAKLEGFGWQVGIGYGLTETAPLLTFTSPGEGHLDTVGKPINYVDIRLDTSVEVDEDGRKRAGRYVCGEILAKGPNIFTGYHNRADLNQEIFTEDGYFRTGDLGYFDEESYLHILGRANTMIVTSSGENIQPEEIEKIYEKHPVIAEIAVFQNEDQLAALIVPDTKVIHKRGDGDFDWHVRIALAAQAGELASYKRIVDYAVTLEPIPRTRLGKIRRHLIKKAFQEAKSQTKLSGKPQSIEELQPADQELLKDERLHSIWKWLCQRYPDRALTMDTNLQFELSIDSLDWLNVTSEIQTRAGVSIKQEAYGRIDTVRDLLQEVSQAEASSEREAVATEDPMSELNNLQKKRLAPLSGFMQFIADGYWYLNRWIMRRGLSLTSEGVENVPHQGPFVLAANHVSHIDPLTITASLDIQRCRQIRWAGWTGAIFHNPISRFLSYLGRTVPIDPQASARSSLAVGSAVLSEGYVLGWFPEGSRSPTGKLQDFKTGLGIILTEYDVPVVPIYIDGSFEVLPTSRLRPKKHPVTVRFGKPLLPSELQDKGSGETRAQKISNALREEVKKLGGGREA